MILISWFFLKILRLLAIKNPLCIAIVFTETDTQEVMPLLPEPET